MPEKVKRLSLQEALRTAMEQNLQVQIAKETRAATTAGVSIAQGAFDWTLISSFSYTHQDSATTKPLSSGVLARTEATSWNRNFLLGAQKPFEWGGNLQLNYSPTYSYSKGIYLDPSNSANLGSFGTYYPYSAALSGTYTQSLLKGFGREATEVNVIVAKSSADAANYLYRLSIINLMASTESQYWDLVFAERSLENTKLALALAQKWAPWLLLK
jgi:outer membrane protein TolC